MDPKGFLNIDKAQDYTSFDCVAILRRVLGIKRIGHTGTLDPMATGVLACAVGTAARALEYLEGDSKEYRGVLKLGIVTDSCDIWGNVLSCRETALPEEAIREAFSGWEGEIEQVPPLYSAIKVEGKKLYEYARAGKEVEIRPRTVRIDALEVESIQEDEVAFRLVCGGGTYVRSLCRDIGERLGVGGCMAALDRCRTGRFSKEDSLPIEAVKEMSAEALLERMLPLEEALSAYPCIDLGREEAGRFLEGQALGEIAEEALQEREESLRREKKGGRLLRVCGEGRFLGMGIFYPGEKRLKADKILAPERREEFSR